MKTTDSVMREKWEVEFDDVFGVYPSEKFEGITYFGKASIVTPASIKSFLSHSLAEARREERERVLQEIGNVASAGNVGEQTKLSFKWLILELESRWHKSDLLTGDNPKEAHDHPNN